MIDHIKVMIATQQLLEGLGVDLSDHNFAKTPERVAKVFEEMFAPPEIDIPVFDEKYTDIVIMRGHEFYTMCPHHLLPVRLVASVAYLPNGKVIGASKLIRMIHDVNRGPMTQEALTDALARRITELTEGHSRGEAILLRGEHGCFRIRGVRSHGDMITHKFTGEFAESADRQRQFFQVIGDRI